MNYRKAILDLQTDKTNMKTYASDEAGGLYIDFSITKTIGSLGEQAEITVTGLALKDIQYLVTIMQPRKDNLIIPNNYISFSAGYTDNCPKIFEGGIYEVSCQLDSSDLSVTLRAGAGYTPDNSVHFQKSFKNTTIAEIASSIAGVMKCPVKITSNEAQKTILPSKSFNCSAFQAIKYLDELLPNVVDVYLSDGVIHVVDGKVAKTNNIISLSAESGLIGTPIPTLTGANVKSLLKPNIQAGRFVDIVSKKLPMLSGIYRVVTLKHTGSTRGGSYYSEMEVTRYV